MPGNPEIVVDFVANTAGLAKGMAQAGSTADGFASKLKGIGKAGALAAGAAGVGALVATVKVGIGEWEQSTKVAAQTEAVLKSTGKAAGVTAGDVDKLANSIMKKSGIDDEAIKSGENLLLTFTNVRNEAGKGNDVFSQATGLMADMSTALGQDATQSAMQLGKALNDPVKGMTALRRVGVSFTEAQKEQVKAMQESGDTMGAQKIILGELTKEFGGSAEAVGKTFPGQLAIVRESFNNFAGDLVGKAIPYLQTAFAELQKHWPEIQAALQTAWGVIQPLLAALFDLIGAIAQAFIDHWPQIKPIVEGIAKVIGDAVKVIVDVVKIVTDLLNGDWSKAWTDFKKLVRDVVTGIKDLIHLEFTALVTYLGGIWGQIAKGVTSGWDDIKSAVSKAAGKVIDWFKSTAWTVIQSLVLQPFDDAKAAVTGAFDVIKTAASGAVDFVKTTFNGLVKFFTGLVGDMKQAAGKVADAIKGPINAVLGAFNSLRIPGFNLHINMPGPVPDISFGWGGMDFPDVPLLARGGIIDKPTLAMLGEAGREIVTPEELLREIVGQAGNYTLNLHTRRADANDIVFGFRRLELRAAR